MRLGLCPHSSSAGCSLLICKTWHFDHSNRQFCTHLFVQWNLIVSPVLFKTFVAWSVQSCSLNTPDALIMRTSFSLRALSWMRSPQIGPMVSCGSHSSLHSSSPVGGARTPDNVQDDRGGWSVHISSSSAATLMCYEMGAECRLQGKRRCRRLQSPALQMLFTAVDQAWAKITVWRMAVLPRVEHEMSRTFHPVWDLESHSLSELSLMNLVILMLDLMMALKGASTVEKHLWYQLLFVFTLPPSNVGLWASTCIVF